MRQELLEHIRCPVCGGDDFALEIAHEDDREIREGRIDCRGCSQELPIRNGIADLLAQPSTTIQDEQKGWVEMLGQPPAEIMTREMLGLPYLDGMIWQTTAQNFDHALDLVQLDGKKVLDVGAGRCWSSRYLARAGADYVLALDILSAKFIGLETADIYFEHDGIYFDRILGDMNSLPVGDATFDVVFMTGTLHHSSSPELVMHEVARALKPGGVAMIINEPVRIPFKTDYFEDSPEILHGINENVYTLRTYLSTTRQAGLEPRLLFPRSVDWRLDQGDHAGVRQELGTPGFLLVRNCWRRYQTRRLLKSRWVLPYVYLIANMPLVMIATKS